jgi:asparagine synthase (glutamine-hydrolysing)
MCGIAGILAHDNNRPRVQENELTTIQNAMIERGPDGSGIWISKNRSIGLAHRRLSIIDLSPTGSQPMHTKNGHFSIVFNGEIYNYRELRKELESKGYQFESTSDTEVLLYLYEDIGEEMVHSLRGMFAFAIWDEREKNLFLSRDHFGIKPLYYSHENGTFRFSSQVKALLAGGAIKTTPDPAGHVGFFLLGSVPEPYTLYKEIHSIPAGSTLKIDSQGRLKLNTFFSINKEYSAITNDSNEIDSHELQAKLRTSLLDSVKYHLVADVPVGLFLSSGLDSSTLVGLASEINTTKIQTVTLKFQEFLGTENDEAPLAEIVAKHYETTHQSIQISSDEFNSNLNHIFSSMDQPSIDGINTYLVSKVAAQLGLKTAISGIGADEIFGGYSSFSQIPSLVKKSRSIPFSNNIGKTFRLISGPILKHFTSPKYAGIIEYGSSYGGAYLLRRGLYMPWELPEVLDYSMVRDGWSELQPLIRMEETTKNIKSNFLKISALELEWYMRNQLLRDADWAGMAHSIEIRTPFVDKELFQAICLFHRNGNTPNKQAMAKTPKNSIPEKILNRTKTGFSIPHYQDYLKAKRNTSKTNGTREWAKKVYQMHTK